MTKHQMLSVERRQIILYIHVVYYIMLDLIHIATGTNQRFLRILDQGVCHGSCKEGPNFSNPIIRNRGLSPKDLAQALLRPSSQAYSSKNHPFFKAVSTQPRKPSQLNCP